MSAGPGPPGLLFAANVLVLSLGGLVTYLAYRAFRRTETRPLRGLTVGFASITLGSALGGGLEELLALDLRTALLLQGLLTLFGFACITRALYVDRRWTTTW